MSRVTTTVGAGRGGRGAAATGGAGGAGGGGGGGAGAPAGGAGAVRPARPTPSAKPPQMPDPVAFSNRPVPPTTSQVMTKLLVHGGGGPHGDSWNVPWWSRARGSPLAAVVVVV